MKNNQETTIRELTLNEISAVSGAASGSVNSPLIAFDLRDFRNLAGLSKRDIRTLIANCYSVEDCL
ncbi:MAG: hypothetical protein HRT73_16785 [Flavobacteriales bacterium]|nr:hypothetical protein [Flavobacteriales bacterium]